MLDFITVVFKDELPLLKIQARSISRYVNQVNNIIIVVNDDDAVADLIDTAWWGQHQDRVIVIPYSHYQYTSRVNGWENQQLLKLLAASNSTTTWSIVLDAKTWFVQPLDFNHLFDSQGCPMVGRCNSFPEFADSQKFVEEFYNIKFEQCLGPGGVPFVFHTDTVNGLVNSIENFPDFFQTALRYPNLATEFHLYSGYVLHRHQTYDVLYNKSMYYSILNIADWEAGNFDQLYHRLKTNKTLLTASIHRRTYKELSNIQIKQWIDFLKEKNLITDEVETQKLLNTYIK
jgi:hypothetical protein